MTVERLIKELNLLRLKANECFNGMTLYDKNEKWQPCAYFFGSGVG